MGLLDSLFGGGPKKAQEQQQAMAVAAPVTPEQERLQALVQAPPREGLIRGKTFGAGSTLGNIIGTLGDAFLVGQGRAPIYQQRLARKNEADALDGFTDDPLGAIKRLSKVSPDKATILYDRYMDNERMNRSEQRLEKQMEFAQREKAHNRSVGMLGAARDQATYDAMLKRANSYRQTNGLPPLDLPAIYDPDEVKAARYSAIDPEDQQRMEDQSEYREDMSQYRRDNLAEREGYHADSIAEREASRKQRAALGEASIELRRESNNIRRNGQKAEPKVVQTKDGAIRYSADRTTAGHVDSQGVKTKLIKVGGKWKAVERIIPGPEGDTRVVLVGDKWVKKETE